MLGPYDHRYFCLTPVAWKTLKLSMDGAPCWPGDNTAFLYLRRYLGHGPKSWSYDGIIAYFLYLLRPSDAYVTNIAKCHFDSQTEGVFDTCIRAHLAREVMLFIPNVVLSFTGRLTAQRRSVAGLGSTPVLDLYHPASRVSTQSKIDRFLHEVDRNSEQLTLLGHDPTELKDTWQRHSDTVRGTVTP